MKPNLLAILLIASVAVAGCASSAKNDRPELPGYALGCPGDSEKIKSKEDLIESKLEKAGSVSRIDVADLRCSPRSGLLRVDVDLKNTGGADRSIAYRFRWVDKDGMRAWDDETWKPVLISGNTLYTITTTSPSPDAADFRVVIKDQDQ